MKREKHSIGFDECLRKALSDGSVQFLKQKQVLQLQAINTLRGNAGLRPPTSPCAASTSR